MLGIGLASESSDVVQFFWPGYLPVTRYFAHFFFFLLHPHHFTPLFFLLFLPCDFLNFFMTTRLSTNAYWWAHSVQQVNHPDRMGHRNTNTRRSADGVLIGIWPCFISFFGEGGGGGNHFIVISAAILSIISAWSLPFLIGFLFLGCSS
jgi:hypothetical protein